MLKYLLKRLLLVFVVVLGVTVVTFSVMHCTPGDPAEMIAIGRYGMDMLTPSDIEWVRATEGLDAPIYVQYGLWLNHLLHGDLWNSLITGDPVLSEILMRFPATMELAILSMILSLVIAIPLGIAAAIKQYSLVDNFSMIGALVGVSMPNFWLGLLLILFFSLYLGWFPVCGYGGFEHLILPAITLGTGIAAITTRLTRSSMLVVLSQDYIRTARAKGLSEKLVISKHAVKNAFIPVITVIGLQFGYLLEGVVIVETIFAWPGVGRLLVDSIFARDFFMIQGCVVFIVLIFALINLIVDISYVYLDPRIRYQRRV